MLRGLWTAGTGMHAQMLNLDVIANNLANANTVAFKKSRTEFQDLLYQTITDPGAATGADTMHPSGLQVGVGTKPAGVTKQFAVGSMQRSERDLDIAISGAGFLQVTTPDGNTAYTRDGALKLDANGNIVTSSGYAIKDLGTVPSTAKSIAFAPNGTVSYIDSTGASNTVGNIQLAMFVNPSGLSSQGGNLYQKSPASGEASLVTPGESASGQIQQHFIEMSNVSIVEEMVNMISSQRAYEVNSRMIKAADEMLRTATATGGA